LAAYKRKIQIPAKTKMMMVQPRYNKKEFSFLNSVIIIALTGAKLLGPAIKAETRINKNGFLTG
jgi:hypothetical protein